MKIKFAQGQINRKEELTGALQDINADLRDAIVRYELALHEAYAVYVEACREAYDDHMMATINRAEDVRDQAVTYLEEIITEIQSVIDETDEEVDEEEGDEWNSWLEEWNNALSELEYFELYEGPEEDGELVYAPEQDAVLPEDLAALTLHPTRG